MRIEIEQEEDGRWLTEIPELPGVMVYGATREEAIARVKALALRVLADRLEPQFSFPGDPFPSIAERAQRVNWQRVDETLARVPSNPPLPGDEL
jgi:predicted RNase H-like HicB family nuclease